MKKTMSATLYPAETDSGGTVTSYIPLATSWSASEGCSSSFRFNGPSLMAFDPAYGIDVNTNAVCNPPAVTTWWNQGNLGGGGSEHTIASIGPLTCPGGFSTVVTSVKDTISTKAMCCPSGYNLEHGSPGEISGDCLSTVTSGMVLTYASTPASDTMAWVTSTTTLSSSSTVGAIAVVGWNINSTPTSTTSISSTTSSSSSTSTSSPSMGADTATQTSPESSSGDNLSSGAKAGIGVGVAVGAIGVIALIIALLLLRRSRRRPTGDQFQVPVVQMPPPPITRSHNDGLYELPGKTDRPPVELAAR